MTTHLVPATIDNSGQTDVSRPLTEWTQKLVTKPDDVVMLRSRPNRQPGVYRVDAGFGFFCSDVTLNLDNCVLDHSRAIAGIHSYHNTIRNSPALLLYGKNYRPDRGDGTGRTNVKVLSSSPDHVARVIGAARTAHVHNGRIEGMKFVASYEAQHGVEVIDLVGGTVIDATNISFELHKGDGAYLGINLNIRAPVSRQTVGVKIIQTSKPDEAVNKSLGCELRNEKRVDGKLISAEFHPWPIGDPRVTPGFHHTARQGIATGSADRTEIDGVRVWLQGRSTFDLEPMAGGEINGCKIKRVYTGRRQLNWVSAAGGGTVHGLHIVDSVSTENINVVLLDVGAGRRRRDFRLIKCKGLAEAESPVVRLVNIDGALIWANSQRMDSTRRGSTHRGGDDYLWPLSLADCTYVSIASGITSAMQPIGPEQWGRATASMSQPADFPGAWRLEADGQFPWV